MSRVSQTRASDFVTREVSAEEAERINRAVAARKKLLDDGIIKAKYKIELCFGEARTMNGITPGIICFWRSGSKFKGGGDEKLYFCPGSRQLNNGCERILPDGSTAAGLLVCPACNNLWNPEQVIGELLLRTSLQHWATVLLNSFVRCEYNADIVLKSGMGNLRSVTFEENVVKRVDGLDKVRGNLIKSLRVYPLRNIIKDTSAGADLYRRLYAFVTA